MGWMMIHLLRVLRPACASDVEKYIRISMTASITLMVRFSYLAMFDTVTMELMYSLEISRCSGTRWMTNVLLIKNVNSVVIEPAPYQYLGLVPVQSYNQGIT